MPVFSSLFLNGSFKSSASSTFFDIVNPSDETIIVSVVNADATDVNAAFEAAKSCFHSPAFKALTGKERGNTLRLVAQKIIQNREKFAAKESENVGKPIQEALADVDDAAACFEYYAGLAEQLDERQMKEIQTSNPICKTYTRYEAKGVCVGILPWNYPLLMLSWKLAPMYAAGCTAIIKPSEFTPLTAIFFAEIAGSLFHPGSFNLVTGTGKTGALLTELSVDKVAFTGSTVTGSKIATTCAQKLCEATFELGGKSPLILFQDFITNGGEKEEEEKLRQAVDWIMLGCFFNAGQVCSATSRVLIEKPIFDRVVARLVEETSKIFVGNVNHPENKDRIGMVGPIVCKSQFEKVQAFVEEAKQQGAIIKIGGYRIDCPGFFYAPTVLIASTESRIFKEEVFGPVLTVLPFDTEEDALRISNNSEYGLGSAVFTDDAKRMERVTKAFEAGIVWQNCSQPTLVEAPWGGIKRSGFGRELGTWGLENYLYIKQVTKFVSKEPFVWFAPKL